MEGNSSALEEGLQRRGGEADIEPLMNQLIRDTVVMMIHFDVVIDIDLGLTPFSENVAMNWQGFEGGFVQTLVKALAGSLEFFERTMIEDLQLRRNRLIEVYKTEEGAMPQRSQNPALRLQNPRLHFRLVPSLPDPGRNNDGAIMLGELPVRGVKVRFITTGQGNGILQVVRNEKLRHSLEELEGMSMGLNPGGKVLGQGSLRKGVIAGSQSGHKDLGLADLPRLRIDDLHRLSGIIDEELFSSPIVLTETGIQFFGPLMVETAKLAILVPFWILLSILMPEQLKCHSLLLQLSMKILWGRHLPLFLRNRMERREEPMLQGGFVQFRRKGPTESCLLGPIKVFSNRTPADIKTFGNLSGRQTLFVMQT
jgi:hypothetical protein